MKHHAKSVALLLFGFISFSSHASIIFDVTNTLDVNCAGSPHGLWTNSDLVGGNCSNYFSMEGTFTLYNDDADNANWYAVLSSTAINPQNTNADVNLTFSGFQDSWSPYKQEDGAPYNPSTMDFFTNILGTIDIAGTSYDFDSFVGDYVFQYGEGANAKDENEYGASAWIQSADISSHHWDINLTLTPSLGDFVVEVPEPSPLLLYTLAILSFVMAKKWKISKM
tara:strand:- start:16856 stop:17527 length:672 start_codon:yes stop_codon:yes gene_type:complete